MWGGNDQIPGRLAAELSAQLVVDHSLVAIKENSDSTYTLTLQA